MLASRQQRVAEYVGRQGYPAARQRQMSDGYAYQHGRQRGLNANTGEKPLAAARALTA